MGPGMSGWVASWMPPSGESERGSDLPPTYHRTRREGGSRSVFGDGTDAATPGLAPSAGVRFARDSTYSWQYDCGRYHRPGVTHVTG